MPGQDFFLVARVRGAGISGTFGDRPSADVIHCEASGAAAEHSCLAVRFGRR